MTLYEELIAAGESEQLERVMDSRDAFGQIDHTFLGFTDIYQHLSKIVPIGRKVLDFGACFAFQGWYFRNHKAYIAVEPSDLAQFRVSNGTYLRMTASDFISDFKDDPRKYFAICNYVPPWYGESAIDSVRKAFPNVFTFYPETGDHPEDIPLLSGKWKAEASA